MGQLQSHAKPPPGVLPARQAALGKAQSRFVAIGQYLGTSLVSAEPIALVTIIQNDEVQLG
jgi:hypothetical protein